MSGQEKEKENNWIITTEAYQAYIGERLGAAADRAAAKGNITPHRRNSNFEVFYQATKRSADNFAANVRAETNNAVSVEYDEKDRAWDVYEHQTETTKRLRATFYQAWGDHF